MGRIQFRRGWLAAPLANAVLVWGCAADPDAEGERPPTDLLDDSPGEITQALSGGTFAFAAVNHLAQVEQLNSWSSNAPDSTQPAATAKIGTGRVIVALRSAGGNGGNVQIIAHNSFGHRCELVGFHPVNGHELIEVHCTNHNGTPFDTAFWVQYTRPPAFVGNTAYVTLGSSLSVEVPHTPPAHVTFNSNGAVNTIVKEATGLFRVNLPTIWQAPGPMVQVTAAGTSGEYCKIRSDTKVGTRDFMVKVACYNAIGQPADAMFSLNSFVKGHVGHWGAGAYGRADQLGTLDYVPSASWNSGISPCGSDRSVKAYLRIPDPFGPSSLSSELYEITFAAMDFKRSVPHITAQGEGNTYCAYAHSDTFAGTMARVFTMCFTPSTGTRIRSNYYASLASNRQPCAQ